MTWTIDKKAENPDFWDIVWARPYVHYEGHHKFFWDKIKEASRGEILDVACGSASCWIGYPGNLITGFDFSLNAIREAVKNVPEGNFVVAKVPTDNYEGESFGTIVASGFVNYYRDLKPLIKMLKGINYKRIIITINKIDDFPDRHWDEGTINSNFKSLGRIKSEFYDKIGWFVIIDKL